MSFAGDRRGRVPFALVGVLLLLGASTYATGVTTRGPTAVDRDAAAASNAAVRDLRPALRTAIEWAAIAAARHPVTASADTPVGRQLNTSSPFRDALRLRIALAAERAASTVQRRQGDAVATVATPAVDSVGDVRPAIRRIEVASVRDGAAMQVTIRNVTVTVREGGRVVTRERLNVTLTVAIPVLALHARTTDFEARLDREPLAGPGLGRGLTARLYPVAWVRGYAQYAGAPVADVLGNHHAEVATNDAVLRQQRAAFGRVDPDAPAAVRQAAARAVVRDAFVPVGGMLGEFASARSPDRGVAVPLGERAGETVATSRLGVSRGQGDGRRSSSEVADAAREPLTVSPEATADAVFVDLAGEGGLQSIIADVYRARANLTTTVTRVRDGRRPPPVSPGANWTLVGAAASSSTTSRAVPESTDRHVDSRGASFRTVRVVWTTNEIHRVWRHDDGRTRTTVRTWTDRSRVAILVVVRHAPPGRAPDNPVVPRFRQGGALDGPNLAGALTSAEAALLDGNGGADQVARRAVEGQPLDREASFVGAHSDALEPWVQRDLHRLHRRVRNVSVAVPREAVAAGRTNPPVALARELRSRRATLLGAPRVYDGVADRARAEVRAAYLDAVIRRLEARGKDVRRRNGRYLDDIGVKSAANLSRLASLSERGNRRQGPPGATGVVFVPDGSPAYLSVTAVRRGVDDERTARHPLAVRTRNWFALPHGDVGQVVGGKAKEERRVNLATAGQALVAAEAALEHQPSETLRTQRDELDGAVGKSLAVLRRRARDVVRAETGWSRVKSNWVVHAALARWDGRGERALAAVNGSLAAAVASEARTAGASGRDANLLAARLRVELRDAAADQDVTVPATMTSRTASTTRRVAAAMTEDAVTNEVERAERRAIRRLSGRTASRVPAGLPVAPVPGYWYATVNAWSVTVRGEYRRFAVRARTGTLDGGGAVVRYVRDGSVVQLDVDGDGDPERLGRSERVGFTVSTTVVVAVPPGPRGVGDTDGDRDEQSPGWPCTGARGVESCA